MPSETLHVAAISSDGKTPSLYHSLSLNEDVALTGVCRGEALAELVPLI